MVLAGNYLKPALVQKAGRDLLKIIIIIMMIIIIIFSRISVCFELQNTNAVCALVIFFFLFFYFSLSP